MKKKAVLSIIFSALVLIGAGVVVIFFLQKEEKVKPMIRTGQIEMREIDVASKIPGRIDWIAADEGDAILQGQDLFRLTDRELRAKQGQAQGSVSSAKAQWDMALNGTRPEQIEMAERNLAAAKTQVELAEKTFNRMKHLYDDRLISEQEFDVIRQKYDAAQEVVKVATSQVLMAHNGARSEEIRMAQAQFEKATKALDEAQAYLDESIVRSPLAGIVSKRYMDAGELVSTGYPVLSIIDTTDAWAELNLPEHELAKLRIGSEIDGYVQGLAKTIKFTVIHFSAMANFANWRAQNEKGTFDVRSFTVKLKPVAAVPSLRPGMTVNFDLNNVR